MDANSNYETLGGAVRELTQNISGADLQGAGRRREVEEEALVEEMPGSSVEGIAVEGCLQSPEAHENQVQPSTENCPDP